MGTRLLAWRRYTISSTRIIFVVQHVDFEAFEVGVKIYHKKVNETVFPLNYF